MHVLRTAALCVAGLLCVVGGSGCQLMHELKPYRLQRWNRGTGMESGYDAYFSVTDPRAQKETLPSDAGEKESGSSKPNLGK